MSHAMMVGVVALQVLVFQFLGSRWTSMLPDSLMGRAGGAEGDASPRPGTGERTIRAGRGQRALGIALLVTIVAATASTGLDPALRKLTLAAVSLMSAFAFLGGYVRGRVALTRFAASLPEPKRRTASLQRHTLARHYPLVWEALPVVVILLTLALGAAPFTRGREGLFWLPLLQILVAGGGLLMAIGYARAAAAPQRIRAAWANPDAALRVDQRLRTLELRAFLAARVGIVLLLTAKQLGRAVPAYTGAARIGEWLVVGMLLCTYAAYLLLATRPAPDGSVRGEGPAEDPPSRSAAMSRGEPSSDIS